MTGLARYCRFLLAYNLAVIVWGAYVRASGSGAGCGSHWPSCNGEAVPLAPSAATLVEYSHRLSSGLVVVLVAVLVAWTIRVRPAGHPLRRAAVLSLVFTLTEAGVGAGLVLFKLVAHDESLARAFAISAHLLNTLLLLAALTLAARAAGAFRSAAAGGAAAAAAGGAAAAGSTGRFLPPAGAGGGLPGAATPPDLGNGSPAAGLPDATAPLRAGSSGERGRWTGWAFTLGLAGTMALAVTGAVAALGDTLFPASSLQQGLAQDLSPASHQLLRLRSVHPLLAVAVGIYLLYLCREAAAGGGAARRWGVRLRFLVLGQGMLGLLNIALLAPVWLQLTHLLVADLVWIALVLMTFETLAGAPAPAPLPPLLPAPARG